MNTVQSSTQSTYVTGDTVQEGDVLSIGAGTPDWRHVRVESVERWLPNNGYRYCADVVMSDGQEFTMYATVIYHRAPANAALGYVLSWGGQR